MVFILFLTCRLTFAESAEMKGYPTKASLDASISNIDEDLYLLREQELKTVRSSLSKDLTDEERKTSLKNKLLEKNRMFLDQLPPGVESRFTRANAEEIQHSLLSHPVAGNAALTKYDPKRKIGFCFGRAAYVHLELLRRGVSPKNTGKVFALGKLYNGYSGWDFHVSTVVKTDTGEWIAIDSLMSSPLPVSEWMKAVSQWNADPAEIPLRFYFTDAVKFQPTPGAYDKERLESPIYSSYFKDLLESFKEGPKLAP